MEEQQQGKPAGSDVTTPHTAKITPEHAQELAKSRAYRHAGTIFGADANGNGGFEAKKAFASGGASRIYKGIDRATEKEVIIKVLRDEYSSDPEVIMRFNEEATAAELLREHPHIMSPISHGEEKGDLYIVYEFIDGAVDHSRLTTNAEEDAEVLLQTLDALVFAHSKEVLHRDIKPNNTLVKRTPEGIQSWLLDFGLGKIKSRGEKSIQTVQGSLWGTPNYISPEQAEDLSSADEKSDLFSLACMAFNLHTEMDPIEDSKFVPKNEKSAEAIKRKLITDRINPALTFDLWINDGVAKKRYELEEQLKTETDEKKRRRLERQLENTQEVSEDYQDLWERVRLSKDRTIRPKPVQILSRLEKLVKEKRVTPRPQTAEELAKNAKAYEDTVAERDELKKELSSLDESTVNDNKKARRQYNLYFSLGQALESLTELTPRTDTARLEYIKEAVKYYGEAHTHLRLHKWEFEDYKKTEAELKDIVVWAKNTQHLEYKRMQRMSANIERDKAKETLTTVDSLIQSGDYESAAKEYGQITTTIPDELKKTYNQVTEQLRKAADSEIEKALETLGSDRETTESHYKNARMYHQALRDNAGDISDKVANLETEMRKHTVAGLYEDYKEAKGSGAFYEMAELLDELETHTDLSDEVRKSVREGRRTLRPKNNNIALLRQFVKTAEELENEISEYEIMTPQQVEDYSGDVDEQINQLETAIKPENIGPYYDEFKSHLQTLRGEVKSHQWAADATSPDYETRVTSLFNLTMHYRSRDDREREVKYGNMLKKELDVNLTERETMLRKKKE